MSESAARIVLNGTTFDREFVPDRLTARDRQVELLESCLEPARNGRKPTHVWLHGRPGTGKTVTAMAVLARLKQDAGVPFVVVNCWQRNSLYEILDHIVTELKIFRAEEHRTSVKLQRLQRHLGNRCIVILLDEIDKLPPAERSSILYSLDAVGNTGLVCVSNDLESLQEVGKRPVNPVFRPRGV